MSSQSKSDYALQNLKDRQTAIKEQISAELIEVQRVIHLLTAEMIEDIGEYTNIQVQSCDDIFREIDRVQRDVLDLSASHGDMKQLFSKFSSHFTSILQGEIAETCPLTDAPHTASPSTVAATFATSSSFSEIQDSAVEGSFGAEATALNNSALKSSSPVSKDDEDDVMSETLDQHKGGFNTFVNIPPPIHNEDNDATSSCIEVTEKAENMVSMFPGLKNNRSNP